MHLSSPIIFSASVIPLVTFAYSFEHLIKTMKRMHYSKAIIRAKVALQEMTFDWRIV